LYAIFIKLIAEILMHLSNSDLKYIKHIFLTHTHAHTHTRTHAHTHTYVYLFGFLQDHLKAQTH